MNILVYLLVERQTVLRVTKNDGEGASITNIYFIDLYSHHKYFTPI